MEGQSIPPSSFFAPSFMLKSRNLCSKKYETKISWSTHCPQCWFGVVKRGEQRRDTVDEFPDAIEVTPEEIMTELNAMNAIPWT